MLDDAVLLGYGIQRSSDGSVYQGMYHNNKRHGHGCVSYGYVVVVVVVVVIIVVAVMVAVSTELLTLHMRQSIGGC